MQYKNIFINEKTTYQDNEFGQIYLKIIDLNIPSFNALKAEVLFSLYKSKQAAEEHPDWQISVNEISTVWLQFGLGDPINADTIGYGVKMALLRANPEWKEANIIVE